MTLIFGICIIFLLSMQRFDTVNRIHFRKGVTAMPSPRSMNAAFAAIYDRQVDTVYRVCYSFMKNRADTEDMVQETFLRLLSTKKTFENQRHEKAWLIVTASNLCKDSLKKWWRKSENIDDFLDIAEEPKQEDSVLEIILQLPNDYKDAVYMYYYEGYSTVEIAQHLKCPEATVRSRLSRARRQLQSMMGGVAR